MEEKELILNKQKTLTIKGIAILFVILSHCGFIECGGAIGVNLFLLVSGYGIYFSMRKNYSNFWKKRITTVYYPYLFTTLIFIVLRFVFGFRPSLIEVVVSILGLDFNHNIDPTMWYISYIFAMYALAYFYVKTENGVLRTIGGGLLIITITLCSYKYFIWHRGTIAWAYGLSFPIGFFLGKYKDLLGNKIKNIGICTCALSIALLFVEHETYIKMIFPLVVAMTIMVFVGFIHIDFKSLKFLGSYSFFMYLNEWFVISSLSFLIHDNFVKCFVSIIVSLVFAIALSHLYTLLTERILRG